MVEVTEGATNQALFRSEDLLQSLHNGTLHSEVGVEGTGDTHRVVGTIGTMNDETDGVHGPQDDITNKIISNAPCDVSRMDNTVTNGSLKPKESTSHTEDRTTGMQGMPNLQTST